MRAVAEGPGGAEAAGAKQAGSQLAQATADPRRRRPAARHSQRAGGDNPMARAIEAMGRAAAELERLQTGAALPHEMEALNQLLKAEADVRRRQVARQQGGGGGGGNRPTPDLSDPVRPGAAQAAADQLRDAQRLRDPAGDHAGGGSARQDRANWPAGRRR